MPFLLFTHDPDEEAYDEPRTLLSVADWLAADDAGRAPFAPDPYEGVGVQLDDGVRRWTAPAFGDARSMAANAAHAADRLDAGELALFRTAILDKGSYLFFTPRTGRWSEWSKDLTRGLAVPSGQRVWTGRFPTPPTAKGMGRAK